MKRTAEVKVVWQFCLSVVRFTDSDSKSHVHPALKRWAISIPSALRTWKMTFAAKPVKEKKRFADAQFYKVSRTREVSSLQQSPAEPAVGWVATNPSSVITDVVKVWVLLPSK